MLNNTARSAMTLVSQLTVLTILLLSFHALSSAENEISIEDFAFMSGYWRGEGMGGRSEEMWMPPAGARMFGIFKQSDDSGLIFSEFMEITNVEGEFVLRLKHFNPDFSGWEEKTEHVTFRFESVVENKVVFGALSYERVSENKLRVELRLRESDGKFQTEVFNDTRTTQ